MRTRRACAAGCYVPLKDVRAGQEKRYFLASRSGVTRYVMSLRSNVAPPWESANVIPTTVEFVDGVRWGRMTAGRPLRGVTARARARQRILQILRSTIDS